MDNFFYLCITGHALKSALKHILCVDRRDNTIFPTEGTLFRFSQVKTGESFQNSEILDNPLLRTAGPNDTTPIANWG